MAKNLLSIFLLMFVTLLVNAQTVIHMEKENGVFKIPCKVNGARMKMIFDTGASSVSLSMVMANYLFENDYIKKEDMLGKGQSQVADGSIVDHIIINLRDIEISGIHLKNVKATVIDGQNVPLLLGQTAIQQLGPVTISGNSLIINKYSANTLSAEEVNRIKNDALKFYSNKSYFAAIEYYDKLRNTSFLNTDDYFIYTSACNRVGQYKKTVEIVSEWEGGMVSSDNNTLWWNKEDIYYNAVDAYWKLLDYDSAIKYVQKDIASRQVSGIGLSALMYSIYANLYIDAENFDMAISFIIKSIEEHLKPENTISDIFNGRISNEYGVKEDIGELLNMYAYCLCRKNGGFISNAEKILRAGSAMCGYKDNIEWCERHNVNYKVGYRSDYKRLFRVNL